MTLEWLESSSQTDIVGWVSVRFCIEAKDMTL